MPTILDSVRLFSIEEITDSPSDAHNHLANFIKWLGNFLDEINRNTKSLIFESQQIKYFPDALLGMKKDGHLEKLIESTNKISEDNILAHGLYGAQLRLKLGNINFHLQRFLAKPTSSQLDRLLSCIITLLDSLLDAIPGGKAIKELIEALQHALKLPLLVRLFG